MDFSMRCNSLKCRSQLSDRAVVTTCSHIFCVPCSESLGLAHPTGNVRVCPACETQLSNPDDVVVSHLNPTEDYKTSVLSGLNPTVIMECAGRGLSFYSYQTAQEIVYQEFLARSLTDKYSTLSSQMDQVIHDANTEITSLQDKLAAVQMQQKSLEQKCEKLAESCREKEKAKQQLQKLYTTLKQQQLATGMEVAADHNAENVLDAAHYTTANHRNGQHIPSRSGSLGSGGSGRRLRQANPWQNGNQGSRAGIQSAPTAPVHATPLGHRTRLPAPVYGNSAFGHGGGSNAFHQGTPHRSVLSNLDPNVYTNRDSTAYGGFGTGVKVGRPQNRPLNRVGSGDGRLHIR